MAVASTGWRWNRLTFLDTRTPGGRLGAIGAAVLAGFILLALLGAPLVAPYEPYTQVTRPFAPPSWAHPLGANDVGHDLASEIIFGARVSLTVGIFTALIATVVGALVALVAGSSRGVLDSLLMGMVDVSLALPFLPLMIVLGVFLGGGLGTEVLVISGVLWARSARELRSQVLSLRERGPVQVSRSMGAGSLHIIARHILPGIGPLLIPQFVRSANIAILLEASLSFLGLGDPLNKSWGTTLFFANARGAFLTDAWLWWVLPTGLCIALVVVSFAFIGFALEERSRPHLAAAPAHIKPRQRGAGTAKSSYSGMKDGAPLLAARGLVVSYITREGEVRAVNGVDLEVERGQVLGIDGESGCGKSTLAAALLRLVKPPGQVLGGSVWLERKDIYELGQRDLRRMRGSRLAYIPQAAMNALNPVLPIAGQLVEAITLYQRLRRSAAKARAVELLEMVGIPSDRAGAYPHEFSGGMRQRAVIAMALANDPTLVIADEPTTGLDVITQGEILALLADLRSRLGLSIVFISHDLTAALRICDRLAVMHGGKFVEVGPAAAVAARPAHAYTRELVRSIPKLRGSRGPLEEDTEATGRTRQPFLLQPEGAR